ncbi:adenosylmethionine decarboxylase [Neptuniibacter sp. CAU 1671]|uniref:adenosylmethionine decarboxylase n=1 Tax=Neptuniibacter sp. CAU 1671 TaxID=3032593 RepID=UPI0023DB3CFF|nr:adenosylmethionine decarboxylase [Neptuniibacter sp. CAU 1671]MDF2182936.1 adenosylmethionine decarboxylase [Neptuniibacter sp. CAU 1671]
MQEALTAVHEVEEHESSSSVAWPGFYQGEDDDRLDYFIERDGVRFAGTHLIIDLKGATNLDNLEVMEKALRDSVTEAGATLLHIHLHHFTPNGGISGVAVLAESHISVHTWPERSFAAFDVFMCGDAKPARAVPVLEKAFKPTEVKVDEILRGKVNIDDDNYLQ